MGQDFPAIYHEKWLTSLPDEEPEEEPFPSIEEIEQAEAEDRFKAHRIRVYYSCAYCRGSEAQVEMQVHLAGVQSWCLRCLRRQSALLLKALADLEAA